MRHRKVQRKLNRSGSHRRAMFANMVASLIEHGRVTTTERKARELRMIAEKAVTKATTLGELLLKEPANLSLEDRLRVAHAMRMVRRAVRNPAMVVHLFREVAPRYLGRPGGYTRILKLGNRRGDGAPTALVEFVAAEMPEREWDKKQEGEPKKKGVLARLRGK